MIVWEIKRSKRFSAKGYLHMIVSMMIQWTQMILIFFLLMNSFKIFSLNRIPFTAVVPFFVFCSNWIVPMIRYVDYTNHNWNQSKLFLDFFVCLFWSQTQYQFIYPERERGERGVQFSLIGPIQFNWTNESDGSSSSLIIYLNI